MPRGSSIMYKGAVEREKCKRWSRKGGDKLETPFPFSRDFRTKLSLLTRKNRMTAGSNGGRGTPGVTDTSGIHFYDYAPQIIPITNHKYNVHHFTDWGCLFLCNTACSTNNNQYKGIVIPCTPEQTA